MRGNFIKRWGAPLLLAAVFAATPPVFAQDPDALQAFLERAQQQPEDGSPAEPALPQADTVPRSPDMQLSAEPSGSGTVNPFAPPPAVPAKKSKNDLQSELREEAFNAAVTGLLPMEPDEIRSLLERFDRTRQAVEIPIYPYPEPEIVVSTISLDPGSVPPVLKVATGHVSTLSMLDITGKPWPIENLAYGGEFEIIYSEDSNMLLVTPMGEFAYGNMSIKLVEMETPIMFTVETHRDKVHYRFDARVPEFGPMTEPPIIEGGVTLVAGSAAINAILDGVPPDGAVRLDVSGVDGRTTAYNYNSQTYVRTPLTLLSPGWSSSVSSADGMNVYTVANAPVLLLSDKGKVVRARLSEEGEADE